MFSWETYKSDWIFFYVGLLRLARLLSSFGGKMDLFKFETSSECPQGEYVLIADSRFRVEVHGEANFLVVEVSPPDAFFFKITHYGRYTEVQPALEEAANRAVPIQPRQPWRTSSRTYA
ncbi:hypothetical protein GCM10017322_38950 [Paracoccus aerius]|nr:hypothetical protein GCM10017322_38950 [Paracoccus aerius]